MKRTMATGIRIKTALILTAALCLCTDPFVYGAEAVTGAASTAVTTTTPDGNAYTTVNRPVTTSVNIGNIDPHLGDSAPNAHNTSQVKAVGVPYSVGGYTKSQIYTMRASKAYELLTGNYTVYDKKGHKLGVAKQMFNGTWADIHPGKVIEDGKNGGLPGSSGTPYNANPGNLTLESVSKSSIKLYIPSNGYYADIQNIPGNSGGKLVELKTLSVKKWNYAARYCEIYDKDKKRVTFTRENGETY